MWDMRWLHDFVSKFKASALSTKAQVVSSAISVLMLIVIAVQLTDNHQLISIAQQQMLLAAQSSSADPPDIDAYLAEVDLGDEYNPPTFPVYLRNIGGSSAVDVEAVEYLVVGTRTTSQSDTWDSLVPAESKKISVDGEYHEEGYRVDVGQVPASIIVRTKFRSMRDSVKAPKRENCTRFIFVVQTHTFVPQTKCDP
jgi:hypothetical protein